jgi:hypothetical protein
MSENYNEQFQKLVLADAKQANRMAKIGAIGLIPSLLASTLFIGFPFLLVFATTLIIGLLRNALPPKAAKFYLAPGTVVGLVELVIAIYMGSVISQLNFHYTPLLALVVTLGAPILAIIGISVLIAGLVRTFQVSAITAKVLPE